jgi:hypothetical protein
MTRARAITLAGWRRRRLVLAALVVCATAGLSASAAVAAGPTWGVEITHANPFGLQVASCPGGKEQTLEPCGIDPFSGSGLSFARESGFDAYTITVRNTSTTEPAPSDKVGSTLTCLGGPSSSGVSLTYQWLRGGVPISGANGERYTLAAPDESQVIQCQVTASNSNGATAAVSEGALVSSSGGEEVTIPQGGLVNIESPAGKWLVGETVKCHAEEEASPSYQWLRNGKAISGATQQEYTLAAEDEGTALQCQETEAVPGGMAVAMSSSSDVVVVGVVAGEGEDQAPLPQAEALLPAATVVDQLPRGIVLTGVPDQLLPVPPEPASGGWVCKILPGKFEGKEYEGPSAFRCSNSQTLKPGEAYRPLTASVNVLPRAVTSKNEATVSGGGAEASASTTDEAQVTPAVPFGVHCFAVSILDEEQSIAREEQLEKEQLEKKPEKTCEDARSAEEPIPAGSHPFSVGTEFVLNYTTSAAETSLSPVVTPRLVSAGGGPKEIVAELPPGVVGNPQNMPECPFAVLQVNRCPADTAVGYTVVSYATGVIQGGRAQPFAIPAARLGESSSFAALIYNLEPTVGHPAAFGFVVVGHVPFVLEAKVRSDGDYGVSVGDSASAEKVLGNRATFCEYGAHGEGSTFSCDRAAEAPLGSKPFLTSPTECPSAAPLWTLRTNPWDEQSEYSSAAVAMNSVTGCSLLQFEPAIDFKPSPASEGGTSQADEPTGIAFDLKLPQTNDPSSKGTPELKNLKMTLPEGMSVSPSAADGLGACSNAQFGLETEFGPAAEERQKHEEEATGRFVPEASAKPAACPTEEKNGKTEIPSQIGTVEVFTPLLSGAPTIEGTPAREKYETERLTCSQGIWSNGPWSRSSEQREGGVEELENGNHERLKLSYQWLLNGKAMEGAEELEQGAKTKVYAFNPTIYAAEKGKSVQCQVTATNAGGSSVAVTRAVVVTPEPSPVPPFAPPSIAAPSGAASVGNTLTCPAGRWTSKTTPAFTYQWLLGGVPITGANGEGYKLLSEDEGKVIQCQVTASNEAGANKGGITIADSAAVVVPAEPSTAPPLPGGALQGQLFVGEPECSPCSTEDEEHGKLFRLFLQVRDPAAGVIIKLHGTTSANKDTGQLTTTFVQQPQQPFELLQLKLRGGPRATLANAQTCGEAETTAELTPWNAEGAAGEEHPIARPTSRFNVGGCAATPPFNPYFNAGGEGANATTAGAFSEFSVTFSRQDREQDLSGVEVHQPPGLAAMIASVPQCGEAQANAGTCPAESKIGITTSGAGPGEHPYFVQGNVYLTGPYKGAPFGLSIVVPAVAGPFNLGNVVVRSAITVDRNTAAATVTSEPLPQILDGVPFRLRKVNVLINRPGFVFNPTNCSRLQVSGTLSSAQGTRAQVSSPFEVGGCQHLPFRPKFTASTEGKASKANGASFVVKVESAGLGQANIAKVSLQLPVALPSRLTTIQKACVAAVFEANPAACDEGSVVGSAIIHTPVLKNPLTGPAYLVSHGSAEFPDVEFVLQGEGIELVLDGKTDIKKGITYSRFESAPDAPFTTFDTVFPTGPHSALTANVPEAEKFSLCGTTLVMPTTITGQNGAVIKQNTHIVVTGCRPTVQIAKVKVSGNSLLVTAKTGATGTVWVSGFGLRKIKRKLTAGTHRIRVRLTKIGIARRKHHRKTSVRVKLIVGKQATTKTRAVRL